MFTKISWGMLLSVESNLVGLGWGLRSHIYDQLTGDGDAAGPGTTPGGQGFTWLISCPIYFWKQLPVPLGRLWNTLLLPCAKAVLTDGCMVRCMFGNNPKDVFSTWSRMQGGEEGGAGLPRLPNLPHSDLHRVASLAYSELIFRLLSVNL